MGHTTVEGPLSGPSWGARHSLTMAGFFLCVLLYSLRFNLSIGIVAMVSDMSSKQLNNDSAKHEEMCSALIDSSLSSSPANNTFEDKTKPDLITLDWNEKDQGLVLGSFFWGYMVSQYPGGLLAHRYGAKWIISLGMLFAGLLSLVIPHAAYVGGRDLVICVRILQGVGEGLVIPALQVLMAKWTSPQERARLCAICFSGMSFGTAITMIISGHLITAYGWPSVFYVPGILTILWFVVWSTSVFSDPQQHPRISQAELDYLEKTTAASNDHHELLRVPWSKILRSTPFWAIFVSQFCNAWGHNMLKAEGPKYLHSALHFDIHQNSYLSAAPYIGQWIFCILVGRISDYLIETNVLTVSRARKLCNTIGQWGTAATFAGIVLAGCNRNVAVVCFILSGLINGALLSGSIINPMDITPRYVGAVEGVINSAANIAGFGAPYFAGLILHHEPSIIGWRYVFFIPVVCNLIGNSAFLLGASVKPQPWNFPEKKNVVTHVEEAHTAM